MDRTLANVVSQRQTQGQGDNNTSTHSFTTFLQVYSINLAQRFSDIADLGTIDYQSVRRIAEFSVACTSIALETWDELSADQRKRRVA
jgi:hypothetical protein